MVRSQHLYRIESAAARPPSRTAREARRHLRSAALTRLRSTPPVIWHIVGYPVSRHRSNDKF